MVLVIIAFTTVSTLLQLEIFQQKLFVLLKTKNNFPSSGTFAGSPEGHDNTLLGDVIINEGKLILKTNSVERAEKGKKLLVKL